MEDPFTRNSAEDEQIEILWLGKSLYGVYGTHREADEPQAVQLSSSMTVPFEFDSESEASSLSA